MLASWAGQFVFELFVVRNDAHAHGEAVSSGQFWAENWQSEFLQLLAFVVSTAVLVFTGSPESRDGDDEMKAQPTPHRSETRWHVGRGPEVALALRFCINEASQPIER